MSVEVKEFQEIKLKILDSEIDKLRKQFDYPGDEVNTCVENYKLIGNTFFRYLNTFTANMQGRRTDRHKISVSMLCSILTCRPFKNADSAKKDLTSTKKYDEDYFTINEILALNVAFEITRRFTLHSISIEREIPVRNLIGKKFRFVLPPLTALDKNTVFDNCIIGLERIHSTCNGNFEPYLDLFSLLLHAYESYNKSLILQDLGIGTVNEEAKCVLTTVTSSLI